MKKVNEDLYKDDPTPEELVAVIRTEEAKIRRFGREEYNEWRNYADSAYFKAPDVFSWRDLRKEKLMMAADDIVEFTESLGINESTLNETIPQMSNAEISEELIDIWTAIRELQQITKDLRPI